MKKFKIKKENTFKIVFHKDGMFHQHRVSNLPYYTGSYWSSVYKCKEDKLTCSCGIELPSIFSLGYSENFYVTYIKADEKCIGKKNYMSGENIEGKIIDWVNGEFNG